MSHQDISLSSHFTDDYIRSDNDSSSSLNNISQGDSSASTNNRTVNPNSLADATPQNIQKFAQIFSLEDEEIIGNASYIYRKVQQCSTLSSVLETENPSNIQMTSERERYLALCSLFIASRVKSTHMDNNRNSFSDLKTDGLSISDILENDETQVRLIEWFELLNSCVVTFKVENSQFSKKLRKIQKKLIILDCLFSLYEKFYHEYFNQVVETPYEDNQFKLGWYLFILHSCGDVNPSHWLVDFEISHHYFLCCMLLVYKHSKTSVKGHSDGEILKYLQCTLEYDQIESSIRQYAPSIIVKLQHEIPNMNKESIHDFFDKSEYNIELLEKYMSEVLESELESIDFSGRLFLQKNKFIGASCLKLSSAPVYHLKSFRMLNSSPLEICSPIRSPARSKDTIAISPLEATIMSIDLSRRSLANENAEQDDDMKRFFKASENDLSQFVHTRIQTMLNKIPFSDVIPEKQSNERTQLIYKTYFQILRTMLLNEEKRLGLSDFTHLLTNDNFNKSLIICSIETILFAYNMKDFMEIESLLSLYGLQPFDFSKVIESFVLHAPWFSGIFKRHFRSIEEMMLDSLAWKEESLSWMEGRQDSQSMRFFLRKVHRLISSRIHELCDKFTDTTIPEEYKNQIWNIVYYVLNNTRELLLNRNVDHIIMCSVYAVCNKVNKMKNLTFKEIIFNYRCICEANRHISPVEIGKILWQVKLDDDTYGDIVKFYNKVFIPNVKQFILKASLEKSGNTGSMPSATVPSISDMPDIQSPHRKRVSNNLFLSPRRQSGLTPSKSLTPRTKALYSFGEHSTTKIFGEGTPKTPSHNTEQFSTDSKKPTKRALFQGDDTEDSEAHNDYMSRKFQKLKHPSSASTSSIAKNIKLEEDYKSNGSDSNNA